MRGLPALDASHTARTRRWDAVVLGGALPGLVSAVVLGMRGLRVLVVEEEAAVRAHPGLREPLLLTGAGKDGVLGACLRALGIPLIERRRIQTRRLAYQVVLPNARVDVGDPARTAEELAAWGLAKREEALELVRALAGAAAAERDALLAAPIVRPPRRPLSARAGPRRFGVDAGARAPGARGLPAQAVDAPPPLAAFLAAQVRALSNLGGATPAPEAQARLLGAALGGAGELASGDAGLRPLLRHRIEALRGEFRLASGGIQLVSAAEQPGVASDDAREIWLGRALVLNAPLHALAAAHGAGPVPEAIRGRPPTHQRVSLHARIPTAVLPEGMAARLIRLREWGACVGPNVSSLRLLPAAGRGEPVHAIASTVVAADADALDTAAGLRAALEELMPFSEGQIEAQRAEAPAWDSDRWLTDPDPGRGVPAECEIRLSSRPPIYGLDRAAVAALGFEGDLLLGWRAGDRIAAELNAKPASRL